MARDCHGALPCAEFVHRPIGPPAMSTNVADSQCPYGFGGTSEILQEQRSNVWRAVPDVVHVVEDECTLHRSKCTQNRVENGSTKRRCLQFVSPPIQMEHVGYPIPRKLGKTMTKAELIDAVAQNAGVSKVDAERTIGAFFELVVSSAKKGDKVAWPGFGSFSTSKRKARTGRNPQTGAPVQVPASLAMKFTASSTLKSELNPNRK